MTLLLASAPVVPPPSTHALLILLLQLAVLLAVSLLLGRLAVRLCGAAIVGELLTGVVIGPTLLGKTALWLQSWLFPADSTQMHLLDALGQVGVVLLVALTSAQLDGAVLRQQAGAALRVSTGGLVLPLSLGIGAGFLIPARFVPESTTRPVFALFFGSVMAVSAIPVIAKTLTDLHLIHRNVGQLMLTAGMLNDVVAWLLLAVASALATAGLSGIDTARSLAYLIGFVLVAVALRPAVRWVFSRLEAVADAGATIATSTVIILLCAATTSALGIETAFGAFVGGMLVGQKRAARPARLAPFRVVVLSVLAPIFLATAGLRVDLTVLATGPTLLLAAVLFVLATAGKFVGAYFGARASRLTHLEGLALGAGMNARGIVEIVIAAAGLRLGVLDTSLYAIVVIIAIGTSLMAPPLLRTIMRRVDIDADEELRQVKLAAWSVDPPHPEPSGDAQTVPMRHGRSR